MSHLEDILDLSRGNFVVVRQAENPIVAALRAVGGSLMRRRNGD